MYIVTRWHPHEYQRIPVFYSRDPYNTGDRAEYVVCVWTSRKAAQVEADQLNRGEVHRYDPSVWPSHKVVTQ